MTAPTETKLDRGVIFVLRILIGWTFLYAGAWQIWDNFDTAGFLNHVVTFHAVFAVFATPTLLPITDTLVKYGHLLIGLSLISGFMVRLSGPFGILLMITYYFAHMKFPYIEEPVEFPGRLSSRLCDRDRLSDRAPRRPCFRSRRPGRRDAYGRGVSDAKAAGWLGVCIGSNT